MDLLPTDRDAAIVLHCRTGNMSEGEAATLTDLGYTNVFNLAGGFVAWGSRGYEVR